MKRQRVILPAVGGLMFLAAAYWLTAPFVLERTYQKDWSKTICAPVRSAIQKDWFGRSIVQWYCYDVCHMNLLLPLEVRDE